MKRVDLWLLLAILIVSPCAALAQQPAQKQGGFNPPPLTEAQKKALQQNSGRPGVKADTSGQERAIQMYKERQEAEKARKQQLQNATTVAKPGAQGKPVQSPDAQKNQIQSKQYQMNMKDLGSR